MTGFMREPVVEARCMCSDRALSACPGEWEPGCDLGANAAYCKPAAVVFRQPNQLRLDCEKVAGPFATREEAEALLGPLLAQLEAPNVGGKATPQGVALDQPC